MIVGIDLGTSTSEVAILKNGKPFVLRELRGSSRGILPSVVGVNSKGRVVVGEDIVAQLVLKPDLTVQEVKRKMGSGETIRLGAQEYTPQELSAFVLRHLKDEAERYLGEPVTDAVITVPAYFTDAQRRATEDAGELAGLNVRRLINEPTAAALAYGIERPGVEEHVLVYDLGGGTLDVTVLELSEGVLDVLASTGNTKLGGKDFDERLMAHVATACRRQTGVELLASPRSRQRLKAECKKVKEALSSSESAFLVLDNLGVDSDGEPIDFELEVTRAAYESLIADLVSSTREQLDEALAAKGLTVDKIATVLLVGGSTRTPLVRRFVSEYFGGRVMSTEVSPDEAVSLGAAVLAGIMDASIDSTTLVITDVSPHTLGVAVTVEVNGREVDDVFDPLIEKQATIPRTAKKKYLTARDWQEAVYVRVFQGDALMCADNEPVIDFKHPMSPAPAGAELEIEFAYDLNGMVGITVRDSQTGLETKKEIRPSRLRMSESEKRAARQKLDEQWRAGAERTVATQPPVVTRAVSAPTKVVGTSDGLQPFPLYERVAALIAYAEKRVLSVDADPANRIREGLDRLKAAIRSNDEESLGHAEQQLTDLLFDLE